MNGIHLINKAIREPRKALSVALHTVFAPVGHYSYRRFVVLTRDRTGSNMLIQMLNSHPNIAADYEIFAKLYGKSAQSILNKAFARQPFYIKAKGFKIFYYHPQDDSGAIWDIIQSMDDLYVIHLKRRNILRTLVSSRIAYSTGVYGIRTHKEETNYRKKVNPIIYPFDRLRHDFIQTKEWERYGEDKFNDHPMLSIYYEDMVNDRNATFNTITDFLGLSRKEPRTDFKKQGTKRLHEMLENYDQLKRSFIGTEWEVFFDER